VRTHVATLLLAAAAGILALSAPPSPAANAASASPLPGDPSSGAVAQTLVRTPAGVERAPLSPRADPTSADRAAGSARPAADRTADRPGGGIGRADAPATPVIRDLQDQRRASDPVTDSSPPTAPPIHAAAGRPADLTRPGPSDPAADPAAGPAVVARGPAAPAAAPWTLTDWPARRSAAATASTALPDAYRPLVRAYFQP
jgi:hypothetical protein